MANLLFPTLPPGGAVQSKYGFASEVKSFLAIKGSEFGSQMSCVITDYAWEAKERVQETFTLGDTSYLYYLGPSSQALVVSGRCPTIYTEATENVSPDDAGISKFLKFYAADSIQATRKPLDIILGTQHYKGFITGASLAGSSADGADVHGFKLVLLVIPTEA